jgi:hypothetical protein
VLASAPENLAAVRALAEIHEHSRTAAPVFPAAVDVLAGDLATTFAEGAVDPAATAPAAAGDVDAFLDQLEQFASDDARSGAGARALAARDVPARKTPSPHAVPAFATTLAVAEAPACAQTATSTDATAPRRAGRAVAVLEHWLSAIVADRAARG